MSKRKPHCLRRRYTRQAEYAVKGIAAAYVTGMDYVECVNLKTRKKEPVGMSLARAISEVPFQWVVLLCIIGIDANGQRYVKAEEHAMTARYRQSSLVEYLNEQHQDYIKRSANKSQMIAAGWIASPEGRSIDTAAAMDIFEGLGAFD